MTSTPTKPVSLTKSVSNIKLCDDTIVINHPMDVPFTQMAQEAIVTGAILPSGYQVPKNGHWIIKGNTLKDTSVGTTENAESQ